MTRKDNSFLFQVLEQNVLTLAGWSPLIVNDSGWLRHNLSDLRDDIVERREHAILNKTNFTAGTAEKYSTLQ